MTDRKKLLNELRSFLQQEMIDLFIINSTDEYLNEYISLEQNSRFHITGFSGSTGDVIVTQDKIYLFVDGRYHLQADQETDPKIVEVVKVGLDKSPQKALFERLADLLNQNTRIGIVSTKTSCTGFNALLKAIDGKNAEIIEYEFDPVIKLLNTGIKKEITENLRQVPFEIAGNSPSEKLELVKEYNLKHDIDLLLISSLDEIAYLTNLRGKEIPYSSCFKARALVVKDKAYIFTDLSKIEHKLNDNFVLKDEKEFNNTLKEFSGDKNISNVYYHPGSTTLSVFRQIEKISDKVVEVKDSFISDLKSVKTSQELNYLKECYLKTDIVFNRAISWIDQNLELGNKITEKDFSDKVKSIFKEEGAFDLSFEPITASGKNTAIIHYTNPDPDKIIHKGELVLLDCGGYFEYGYATDVTRTFLAGGSKAIVDDKQKYVYTTVLKGLLRGLNLELDENTSGFDLDQAVREIIDTNKPEGFSFSHATGHGVGICVHESPPRIGPSESSKVHLKTGMAFTIEPGLYNEEWGGVRIENTVKIIEEGGERKIKTLTRASFDENLVDYSMLTEQEKTWLEEYNRFKIG